MAGAESCVSNDKETEGVETETNACFSPRSDDDDTETKVAEGKQSAMVDEEEADSELGDTTVLVDMANRPLVAPDDSACWPPHEDNKTAEVTAEVTAVTVLDTAVVPNALAMSAAELNNGGRIAEGCSPASASAPKDGTLLLNREVPLPNTELGVVVAALVSPAMDMTLLLNMCPEELVMFAVLANVAMANGGF